MNDFLKDDDLAQMRIDMVKSKYQTIDDNKLVDVKLDIDDATMGYLEDQSERFNCSPNDVMVASLTHMIYNDWKIEEKIKDPDIMCMDVPEAVWYMDEGFEIIDPIKVFNNQNTKNHLLLVPHSEELIDHLEALNAGNI